MIRKFLRLNSTERRLLLQAWLALPFLSLLLRMVSLARLNAWIDSRYRNVKAPSNLLQSAVRMVEAAGHLGFRQSTCLEKSMVLRWLLLRHGIVTILKVGARKNPEFAAHAWLESNGVPINDPTQNQDYVAFAHCSEV